MATQDESRHRAHRLAPAPHAVRFAAECAAQRSFNHMIHSIVMAGDCIATACSL